jgi:hypothetical protein
MKVRSFLATLAAPLLIVALFNSHAIAQEYQSPTQPPVTGRSPGVKVKLVSDGAYFTAIGDASSAKYGWYDRIPVVHAHANFGTEDGTVRGGHLLEAFV